MEYAKDSIISQYLENINELAINSPPSIDESEISSKINSLKGNGYIHLLYGPEINTYFLIKNKSIIFNNNIVSFELAEINGNTLVQKGFYYVLNIDQMKFASFNNLDDINYANYDLTQKYNSTSILSEYVDFIKNEKNY